MRVFWAQDALEDRRSIYDYIEAENPLAALDLDELFFEKAALLLEHPNIGLVGRISGTREWVVHPNYILIYDKDEFGLRILKILHASRSSPAEQD